MDGSKFVHGIASLCRPPLANDGINATQAAAEDGSNGTGPGGSGPAGRPLNSYDGRSEANVRNADRFGVESAFAAIAHPPITPSLSAGMFAAASAARRTTQAKDAPRNAVLSFHSGRHEQ